MDLNLEMQPEALPWRTLYKLLIGSVVPRPIGWISTLDEHGQPNLAPYSFFSVVCPNPPHVLFCPNIRDTDSQPKDTLHNVRATGEFVVNIVTEPLAAAMNQTSAELPAQMDEFTFAGLAAVPSVVVKPPRVAASPIHFECRVTQIVDVSLVPGGGSVVIGRIVCLHIAEEVLIGDDKIDLSALQPVGRLAGAAYTRVTDLFDLVRPASQITG